MVGLLNADNIRISKRVFYWCKHKGVLATLIIWGICMFIYSWVRSFFGYKHDIRLWARGHIAIVEVLLGVKIEVQGQIPPQGAVIICNHQSAVDPIVLLAYIPHRVVGMFKSSLWIVRGLLERCDWVPVRGVTYWVQKVISVPARASIMVFPEGRRVRDGERVRYRNGAFVIAKECGRKMYMASIDSGKCWGAKWLPSIHTKKITLKFLGRLNELDPIIAQETIERSQNV